MGVTIDRETFLLSAVPVPKHRAVSGGNTSLVLNLGTSWRRVVSFTPRSLCPHQLINKFPTFCGIRRFITVFRTRHLSLS
jgi:hypothetical protein